MVPTIRFDVTGDCALACHFLVANCRKSGRGPTFDIRSNPIALVVSLDSEGVLDEIRAALQRAEAMGGAIARSSRAMTVLLEAKLKNSSLPVDCHAPMASKTSSLTALSPRSLFETPPHPGDAPGCLRFSVIGDISHAAYYVLANWPEGMPKPVFDIQRYPMILTFELTTHAVRALQGTLTKAEMIGGSLSLSARAFRMLLVTKLAGRIIPDHGVPPSQSDSHGG